MQLERCRGCNEPLPANMCRLWVAWHDTRPGHEIASGVDLFCSWGCVAATADAREADEEKVKRD